MGGLAMAHIIFAVIVFFILAGMFQGNITAWAIFIVLLGLGFLFGGPLDGGSTDIVKED